MIKANKKNQTEVDSSQYLQLTYRNNIKVLYTASPTDS